MLSLIKLRQQLLSGNLPIDEIRKLKLEATNQIDTGNSMLTLDMVVRDDAGDIIDFSSISTTQLYELHCKAIERIKQNNAKHATNQKRTSNSITTLTHNFLITLTDVNGRFFDDMELLFTLYTMETNEMNPLAENFCVPWSKGEHCSDIKFLFTDLSTEDLNRSKLFLVCYLVRVGTLEARDPHVPPETRLFSKPLISRRISMGSVQSLSSTENVRRPYGIAILDLTPFIAKPSDFNMCYDMPVFMCEKECLDMFIRRSLQMTNRESVNNDGRSIRIEVQLFHGDIKQIREDYHLLRNISFARKMGFPEVILPGDVRNDLYLTLDRAELPKAIRSKENNVEITVMICNEEGTLVPNAISKGGGAPLDSEYKSLVYTGEERPHWNETLKVSSYTFLFFFCRISK